MLELPDDPPGPELAPGLAEGTLLPPGDGMLEFPALLPGAPVPVFPADIPPGEEVPLVTWFPVIPEFPEFPDGGEYTLPAEPPSMAEASLRHTPELSKV